MSLDFKELVIQSVVEEDDASHEEALETLGHQEIFPGREFSMLGGTWLVLSENEADERVTDYIKEKIGYFRPSFIAAHTDIDEDLLDFLAEHEKHDFIYGLLDSDPYFSWQRLVDDAVSADGYGHFLNTHDGVTRELDGGYYLFNVS